MDTDISRPSAHPAGASDDTIVMGNQQQGTLLEKDGLINNPATTTRTTNIAGYATASTSVTAGNGSTIMTMDEAIEQLGNGPFQRRILLAAGLCFAADSMEVLLLSFLTVVLDVEWGLTDTQTSSITSSVFVGAMLGTLILGPMGDRIGRKPVFVWTAGIICVFGLLTAVVNNYATLVICRFLVGFGVGGLTVPFDTLAEFVPTAHRGTDLLAIEYFWTAGTLLVPILAYFSLSEGNWRLFVALCALPCLLSTLLGVLFVPESPRWLLSQGRHDEAVKILQAAAKINKVALPDDLYIKEESVVKEGGFADLLAPSWRRTTLFLWGTWFGFSFLYYGTIIAVTLVFAETSEVLDAYSFDYTAILASASAELAGTTIVLYSVDRIGRIPSQATSFLFGSISVFALCMLASLQNPLRWHLILTAFLSRMFFMAASCTCWVSTAEIMTTELRTTGHSAANAMARISGAVTPFVISNSTPFTVMGPVLLLVGALTAVCSAHLPETKGKAMGVHLVDTDDDDSEPNTSFQDMGEGNELPQLD